MAVLKAADFSLEIIAGSNNVYVSVTGLQYSGKYTIYCEKSDYQKFVGDLANLFATLQEGEARLQEFYEEDFICFQSDGLGHFKISGEFNDWRHCNLKFEETVDQTYFKKFITELKIGFNG